MAQKEQYWVLGDRYTFEQSGDTIGAIVIDSREGNGPPPHVHQHEDESIFVIDGSVEILADGASTRLDAGEFVFLSRGGVHAYKVVSATARLLVAITPGGFEDLFRKVGTPAGPELADPKRPEDQVEQLLALAPQFGLEIKG